MSFIDGNEVAKLLEKIFFGLIIIFRVIIVVDILMFLCLVYMLYDWGKEHLLF